jgi:hypothetical protein
VLHYSDDRQKPDFSVIRTGSAQYAEDRKEKAYLKKWNIRDASRAGLTFFAI